MSGMTEVLRKELAKGGYQMPSDTLPYETQAASIARALTAAGFGPVAEAKAEALEEAADTVLGDQPIFVGAWLRARATTVRGEG
ncbi:hypothetical protein E5206_09545 [Arthrobacter sp. PAMC25564]|uniref:hypothetical protein n=1 Tax=Arthrobacter sp. PAMC25564 TaxID=2565366 RepID=UPI0010A27C13|nr:hypothetical protein [Arthrobacter sp. PAMC25564]QCB97146.1 hypothetical protein E5206_09545 [Arthrobacter sp. PAMC25564]